MPETLAVDGEEWWSYDPGNGAEASRGNPQAFLFTGVVPDLLDPSHVIPALELEIEGEAQTAGRRAIRAMGRVRRTMRQLNYPRPTLLARGAQAYELLIDQQRGIVLRATSLLDEMAIHVVELTSVEFDTKIDERTFRMELPDGVEVRPGKTACERMAARQAEKPTSELPTARAT